MISAKLILASTYEGGKPIYSIQTSMPKWMLAELNTHRVFSRSSGSSRAIPLDTIINRINTNPYIPYHWGKAQDGMQAKEELVGAVKDFALKEWLWLRDRAVESARTFEALGLHKQVANRALEPWMYIDTIITSTEWANFFELRDHPDAQPEMQVLAKAIREVIETAKPQELNHGEWHLPYVEQGELLMDGIEAALMYSTARCARVSYHLHDGTVANPVADIKLYNKLVGSRPLHASPAEHQALYSKEYPRALGYHRNFVGWVQHRALMENRVYAT